jgi:hypothetical protein
LAALSWVAISTVQTPVGNALAQVTKPVALMVATWKFVPAAQAGDARAVKIQPNTFNLSTLQATGFKLVFTTKMGADRLGFRGVANFGLTPLAFLRCSGRQTILEMNAQEELDFGAGGAGEGYTRWQVQRRAALVELARKVHLPLNHQVEVWLAGGIRLRGKLQLQEEKLFWQEEDGRQLGLRVDHVPFLMHEMESCVRLD